MSEQNVSDAGLTIIAVDGKTLRRSRDAAQNGRLELELPRQSPRNFGVKYASALHDKLNLSMVQFDIELTYETFRIRHKE